MKTIATLLALAAAAVSVVAHPASLMQKWTIAGHSQADEQVAFSLHLPMRNTEKLDAAFWDISTPGTERYGKFMSRQEAMDMTAAPKEDREMVIDYLKTSGATCVERTGNNILCKAPVKAVNKMLKTSMQAFKHKNTGAVVHLVDGDHSFPEALKGKVEFISGLSMLPAERYGRSRVLDLSGSSTDAPQGSKLSVVPETLTNLYNLDSGKGSSKVTQGAVEYQGAPAWSESDLATFANNTGIAPFSVSHTGPFNSLQPFAESTLDVQYLGAVGKGNTNEYFTTATWMYDYANEVLKGTFTADVQSSSYGYREDQNCVINPISDPCAHGGVSAYVKATNTLFQQVGATGVTLVVASGDAGAHGREDQTCTTGTVNPDFPASSPFVTAVGATQLSADAKSTGAKAPICQGELQCATSGSEQTCSYGTGALITSGGGFSVFSKRPSYQDAVVKAYLAKSGVTPGPNDFNSAGRGYPDVAALGHNYYIELNGQVSAVDGTSASCPVFAGIMSIVNSARVKAGKAKLGFANPSLYKIAAEHPAAFNDITEGNNLCTETLCCKTGFYAAAGWDATTGLGSPDISALVSAAVAL